MYIVRPPFAKNAKRYSVFAGNVVLCGAALFSSSSERKEKDERVYLSRTVIFTASRLIVDAKKRGAKNQTFCVLLRYLFFIP